MNALISRPISGLRPVLAILAIALLGPIAAAGKLPEWAYPVAPPGNPPEQDETALKRVPNSSVVLRWSEIAEYGHPVPDWHPEEHPVMPQVVSIGRIGEVWACAYCHMPNGVGRPANASLAGLSAGYIEAQVRAFAAGLRPGSEPRRVAQPLMVEVAKAVTTEELTAAANYFAALRPIPLHKVVESATAPKTYVTGEMVAVSEPPRFEPLAGRIVEVPDSFEQSENRDSRLTYTIYVPLGSLKRGAELVTTGKDGQTIACATCHGPNLQGLGDIPRLAGRSPSYLMRQLYDFQHGTRVGPAAAAMNPSVAKLTESDMVDIVAYLASLPP